MSTSHRPTYHSAVGKASYGGIRSRHSSAKDQAAHKTLKFRQLGQASENDMVDRDLKNELDSKEVNLLENKSGGSSIAGSKDISSEVRLLKYQPEVDLEGLKEKYDDADADFGDSDKDLETSSDEDDDDDDEDDEVELQRELDRIKAERAAAQAKKEMEDKELAEKAHRESAIKGNPLLDLDGSNSAKVKRRWNDDVVFRNQARDEQERKKRFVNDTIRNDFHRSFLKKYVK